MSGFFFPHTSSKSIPRPPNSTAAANRFLEAMNVVNANGEANKQPKTIEEYANMARKYAKKNSDSTTDPMDEVLSSSDEEKSGPKSDASKKPKQSRKRPDSDGEKDYDLSKKRPAKGSSPSVSGADNNGFGILVKTIPKHITDESLKFMVNQQGYQPSKVLINRPLKDSEYTSGVVYFSNSSDGLSWVQLNQGSLKFTHGQSELEMLPGQSVSSPFELPSTQPKPAYSSAPISYPTPNVQQRSTLLPTPNQSIPNISGLINKANESNDQQWNTGMINAVNQSTSKFHSNNGQSSQMIVTDLDWTCYKCMSQNQSQMQECSKCASTKQASEELESKGSQYVGLATCDTLLIRDLPMNADEMIIRLSIMQYMDVVPVKIFIADSAKYCLVQMKSNEDAAALLDLFNKSVKPMINNSPVLVTFSRKSLQQILLENTQKKEMELPRPSANPLPESNQSKPHKYARQTVPPEKTFFPTVYPQPKLPLPPIIDTPFGRFKTYSNKPDPAKFLFEPNSNYYYDPETNFYYDENTQYFYDYKTGHWMFWTSRYMTYIPCEEGNEEKRKLQQEEKQFYSPAKQIAQPVVQAKQGKYGFFTTPPIIKKQALLLQPGMYAGPSGSMGLPQNPEKILEEARAKAPETYEFIKTLMKQQEQIIQTLQEKLPEVTKKPLLATVPVPVPQRHPPPAPEAETNKLTLPKNHNLWKFNMLLTVTEQEYRDVLIKLKSPEAPELDDLSRLAQAYLEYEVSGLRKFLNNLFKFAIRTLPEKLQEDDETENGFDPAVYDAGKQRKMANQLGICPICNQKGHPIQECWAPVICIKCATPGHHVQICKRPNKTVREDIIALLMQQKRHVFTQRLFKIKSAMLQLKKFLGMVDQDAPEEQNEPIELEGGKLLTWKDSALQVESFRTQAALQKKVYNGPANLNALTAVVKPKEDELPEGFAFHEQPQSPVLVNRLGILSTPDDKIINVSEILRAQQAAVSEMNIQPQTTSFSRVLGGTAPEQLNQPEDMELALVQQQIFLLEQQKKFPTQVLSCEAFDLNALQPQVTEEDVLKQVTRALLPKEPRIAHDTVRETPEFMRRSRENTPVEEQASMVRENSERTEMALEKAVVTREKIEEDVDLRSRDEDMDLRPDDVDLREDDSPDGNSPKTSHNNNGHAINEVKKPINEVWRRGYIATESINMNRSSQEKSISDASWEDSSDDQQNDE